MPYCNQLEAEAKARATITEREADDALQRAIAWHRHAQQEAAAPKTNEPAPSPPRFSNNACIVSASNGGASAGNVITYSTGGET